MDDNNHMNLARAMHAAATEYGVCGPRRPLQPRVRHVTADCTVPDAGMLKEAAACLLQKYNLCNYCLGRLFARQARLSTYASLGRRLGDCRSFPAAGPVPRCYICRGLYDGMPALLQMMKSAVSGYEFETFAVGAILKPSVLDRDDRMRSAYRLRGADSVKAGLTKELGRRFARMTGGRHDRHEPEISITIQPAESYCEVRPKPVAVFGRYVKHARGVPQKQDACTKCLGRGCFACEFHGLSSYDDSVEGQVSALLFGMLGGTTARFTWVGGEDRDSLVRGRGRPFFARIQGPKKRRVRRTTPAKLQSVTVMSMSDVPISDVKPVPFASRVKISVALDAGRCNTCDENTQHENCSHVSDDCGCSKIPAFAAGLGLCVGAGSHKFRGLDADLKCEKCGKLHALSDERASSPEFLRGLRCLSGCAIGIKSKGGRIVTKMITHLSYRRSGARAFTVRADIDGGVPVKRLVTGDGVSPSISEILGVPCRCVRFDFEDVHVYKDGKKA